MAVSQEEAMTDDPAQTSSGETTFPMDINTRFSFERTLLSHDRTVLSWVRTAVSLITFGFTIYKFFQLELGAAGRPEVHRVISPRTFAIIMIATGLFALLAATVQNCQYRTQWRRQGLRVPLSVSSLVGGVVAVLGLLALASAVFRW